MVFFVLVESLGFFNKYPSAVPLLVANIITIILAFVLNWSVVDLMLLYVIQSIIIGFFNFLKMLLVSAKSGGISAGIGIFMSFFFLLHYNGFHAVYVFFIIGFAFGAAIIGGTAPQLAVFSIGFFIAVLAFFINHLLSFIRYSKKAINYSFNISDVGKLMGRPYIRIIPMHLTIIFGGFFLFVGGFNFIVLLLFMVLKTIVDLKMHQNEHKNELH